MAQAVTNLLHVEALLQEPRGMGVAHACGPQCCNGLSNLRRCWLTMAQTTERVSGFTGALSVRKSSGRAADVAAPRGDSG